ncbi:MAG: amino acid ABC transporter substrate-binding protein, partial [Candidatus Tectomicrobia bacterium]|nr:amino acid ABC transporter substrate-binding protein [Candidatus Tectomicrobia bacterium]
TGRYSGPGRQARVGVLAWIDDTNRAGGIRVRDRSLRLPVRLICYDDAGQGERCRALTERLIVDDRVDILLGPYASGLTRRAAAVAANHERVLWNHGGSTDVIYRAGNAWVVGILTPASRYFHGVIDAVLDAYPNLQRVAIMHGTTGAFPRDVAAGAAQHCREHGIETVQSMAYPPDTDDFTSLLQPLQADPPDVLLGVGRIEDDLRLAAQLADMNLPLKTIGLIVTPLQQFQTTLGESANGFTGPSQWEPGVVTSPDYGPSTAEVMRSFKRYASEDIDIDYPMAQAYAGCLVVQRCIEAAGSLSQPALRRVAGELDFTTFYGHYRIDPRTGRQLGHVMPVIQWQQGAKVMVWPPQMRQKRFLWLGE